MKYRKLSTLVIGSGAAGLAAALRLESRNISDIAIYTEGLQMGTSINTGSDKQTYYKLGVCGSEPDSPFLLAQDLCRGGSMHGDIALIEASLSLPSFFHLVNLGVPFPHDVFGQYVGYKTDHDPKRRATSCGPYTSRDMCRAMIAEIQKRQIEVVENRVLIDLSVISEDGRKRCVGAIFIKCDTGTSASNENNDFLDSNFEFVEAENIIFATGGPGGLYEQSVYPQVHTGAIGVALRVGALARNLPESQFGLASTQFRWNVSGSYMQALPRFISIDEHGTEREFLRDYFTATGEMYDMIFLKGYQWPFSATHIPGSSLIDLFVSIEQEKGRRVFLDYRYDPKDFDLFHCNQTTREYLEKSQATGNSPIQRLKQLNLPAIEHYQKHGIDLYTEPLEIAVCAQHNNGGLAANIWWESENISGLFPIGEVNGSHGVTRPGGTALNAGQCGAFRCSEWITERSRRQISPFSTNTAKIRKFIQDADQYYRTRLSLNCDLNWQHERRIFQHRMSLYGGFLRKYDNIATALKETELQLRKHQHCGLKGLSVIDCAEFLRNEQLLTAQLCYLQAIKYQIESQTGSRGSALVISTDGKPIHPKLGWKILEEDIRFRRQVLLTVLEDGIPVSRWEICRPIPENDNWFETVWKEYREGQIFQPVSPSN